MRPLSIAITATLIATNALAFAAPPAQTVNLDGSVSAHSAKKGSLAASANRALQANDVPSAGTDPGSVKAAADADMASREKRAHGPRLKVQRQNLKEEDAAHAIAEQQTPSTYDRSIQMGDKDHTEQVTNLKITVKK